METLLGDFTQYLMPELIVLVPVLVFIGYCIKQSRIADEKIPTILAVAGIIIAGIWLFSTREIPNLQGVFQIIFSAIVQGIIASASAVGANQFVKQLQKSNNNITAITKEDSE